MSTRSVLIAASILSADLTHLQDQVDAVASADWLQIDVMDGHFVPNLSFGAPVVKGIRTLLPLDIHLMVSNPADRVGEFLESGAANITFHAEAVTQTAARKALIARIRKGGATVGIAINPDTPVESIADVAPDVDLVLVMSVVPGFSGQEFRDDVLSKVEELRKRHPDLMIQMDGGIDDHTAALCKRAGANNLVAASFIFGAADPAAAIEALRRA